MPHFLLLLLPFAQPVNGAKPIDIHHRKPDTPTLPLIPSFIGRIHSFSEKNRIARIPGSAGNGSLYDSAEYQSERKQRLAHSNMLREVSPSTRLSALPLPMRVIRRQLAAWKGR